MHVIDRTGRYDSPAYPALKIVQRSCSGPQAFDETSTLCKTPQKHTCNRLIKDFLKFVNNLNPFTNERKGDDFQVE